MASDPKHLLRRAGRRVALLAALAMSGLWSGTANAAGPSPFGDAVQVADAALDNIRGGFATSFTANVPNIIPFGIDVDFSATLNGALQGGFSVTNMNGPLNVTLNNVTLNGGVIPTIGPNMSDVTITLASSGVLTLIRNTQPGAALQAAETLNVALTGVAGLQVRNALLINPSFGNRTLGIR